MQDYVRLSLETNLFFARIMKEHAMFLEVLFLCKDSEWIEKATFYREEFEQILKQTVELSNRMIGSCVINSGELVTSFTLAAENQTSRLTGIDINTQLTQRERQLQQGWIKRVTPQMIREITNLNERAVNQLEGLISFKEDLLQEVKKCRLFTANYPLLIEHITREARLYRDTLEELQGNKRVSFQNLQKQENFWNQIMMEHALFIRGLLDPSEEALIQTADEFAKDFQKLLQIAKERDWQANEGFIGKSLEDTIRLKDFKANGTKGILECQIEGLILPLLADHVLREANHYIRILECGYAW